MPHTRVPATAAAPSTVRLYYELVKPGIVYSNLMTAVSGYLYATTFHLHLGTLLVLMIGTGCFIAVGCIINNYIDRPLDARMERTKRRGLVSGAIPVPAAGVFAVALAFIGLLALLRTNSLTVWIGIAAVFSYVVLYGVAKRQSVHGTLVGTLPGAASLLAGYTAATGRLDVAAALLFLIMVCWQMAHFYAISIYRRDDYAEAGLPVRAVAKGFTNTQQHIRVYMVLYVVATLALWATGHANVFFAVIMAVTGGWWLQAGLRPVDSTTPEAKWGRRVFLRSLIVLLVFAVALPLASLFR